MKGKTASLAWGAVHLALLSTGEDRAKAVVDWTWAGFSHERPRPDHVTRRSGGDRDDADRRRRCSDRSPRTCSSIFGITGDLAKVMTFRLALPARAARAARLPDRRRGRRRLDARPARRARPRLDRGDRREARRDRSSSASRRGSPTSRATSPTPRPTSASATRSRTPRAAGLLPRDPAVPVRHGRQGAVRRRPDEERARRRREAVRSRPRLGEGARRRAAPVRRRVADLPHRPLPREDGPRGDPLPPLREHDARADLEPELPRVASRSRWPRTSASRTAVTSTTRSARCATSSSTT